MCATESVRSAHAAGMAMDTQPPHVCWACWACCAASFWLEHDLES